MGNMWRLSIDGIKSFIQQGDQVDENDFYNVSWEPVHFKGKAPGNISHHKAAVCGNEVVIFGGIKEDNEVYLFNADKNTFSIIKQTGDVPKPRDDHSMNQIDADSFLIYGGFVEGSRVNECFIGTKKGNLIEWKEVAKDAPLKPSVRNSHNSGVHNGKCYIYGGQDDDNNKLCDLWILDLATETYSEVKCGDTDTVPTAKSGHTCNVFNGKMYIFGGILELTKEVNEMVSLDLASCKFHCHGEQLYDDLLSSQNKVNPEAESPGIKKRNTIVGGSPTKLGNTQSPGKKTMKASALKPMGLKRRTGKSPSKNVGEKDTKESGLASPTSISMQNSFIIKNADESFDAYWAQMKRRKNTQLDSTMGSGVINPVGYSPKKKGESNFGVVHGVHPAARDGHTTEVNPEGLMFVFGGDRHHMPFNDLYLMTLK